MERIERESFQRVLGRTDVLALAIGTIIGWGWVALTGTWIGVAGVFGSVFAFLAGGILLVLIGNIYAELSAALPIAGGEIAFAYRALGYYFALFVGWAITFAYIGVAAWEGIAITSAMGYLIPEVSFPWVIVGILGAVAISALNYFGTRPAMIFQVIITSAMMLTGFLFLFTSVSFGSISNMEPYFTNGSGVIIVLLIVPSMLIGFDIIPQFAEEMNIPPKQIGNILIFSIVLCTIWYIFIILGISFAAPIEVRNAGLVPVADSISFCLNSQTFGNIMIFGGILGIFSSWNGFMVAATRIIFAMGRAKMIAPIFGKLHPKYKTPSAAILLVGFICSISPLFGQKALIWLVNVSSFEAVLSYLSVSIAFVIIRRKEPNLDRPYFFRFGKPFAYCVIISLVILLAMYSPLGIGLLKWPYEGLIIFIWFVIGVGLAVYSKFKYPDITDAERELLIFGEKYSRDV